ncbi:TetR/AcrR family transcriptional regulator [Paenibacillus sp. N1-5-1-14]|uniref:TetR/AcrR family transcriptional regulator n=1 Tax=Paenibacillus radicibacter TaxID=2972488 RepID=UPI002158CF48|nr:TetR/AcrR family transcriptional regulator [Paenibacillus radicibacter]MCR8643228.1 TetR/AcrR family transcriptional regulator [Paenibacillus radicibacter]
MVKRRYDGDQAQKDIAEHAKILFSHKGYAATSIDDISKAAGYSKGHIYYFYKNKEALFVQLALATMQEWGEKWELTSSKHTTATVKLYAMAHYVLHHYKTPLLRAGQELAADPKTKPETVQQLYGLAVTPMKAYSEILIEGVAKQEFKPINIEEYTLLLSAWLGGLCHYIGSIEMDKLEGMFEEAMHTMLARIAMQHT